MSVRLVVKLDCGHELAYVDRIEEKYPFWCDECDEYCGRDVNSNKWPWVIEAAVIPDEEGAAG